jgi:hypothetical protein
MELFILFQKNKTGSRVYKDEASLFNFRKYMEKYIALLFLKVDIYKCLKPVDSEKRKVPKH